MVTHSRRFFSAAITPIGGIFSSLILSFALCSEDAWATVYFISPAGSDSNAGTTITSPWLTFNHAVSRMVCGDTLNLLNGVYGDGTSTGKISISGRTCTANSVLTVRAFNERQARVSDSGTGTAISVANSAFITFEGIVANSTTVNSGADTVGNPVGTDHSHHLTFKNMLLRNPNKYHNTHPLVLEVVDDALVEDVEIYEFHRHGVYANGSRNVIRRVYCNPRSGGIAGYALPAGGGGVGNADACASVYPGVNTIVENVIADGTSGGLYIIEINALGNATGNQVLGSIGYRTGPSGNGIYFNLRGTAYSLANNTIKDVVLYNHRGGSAGIKVSDGLSTVVQNVTLVSGGAPTGIHALTQISSSSSIAITNTLVSSFSGSGFAIASGTYSGSYVNSYNNGIAFSPSLPGSWTNASTTTPGMGTCVAWIPDASPNKRTGLNGGDIGANILYRYQNGVLTSTPLWDPNTGAFPRGAFDLDGVNRVAGNSLFDVHIRLNVNTNGCTFPASFGGTGSDNAPQPPRNLRVF